MDEVTHEQLMAWSAYFELEPFSEMWADWRAGQLSSMYANAHKAKSRRPYRPSDFFLIGGGRKEPLTKASQFKRLRGIIKTQVQAAGAQ